MAASKRPQGKSRGRRDKENELIGQLSALLPLDKTLDVKLDKLSVLRVTLAFLKCRKSLETGNHSDARDCLAEDSNCKQPSAQNTPVPLAMLDNDGNLVAGTLANPALTISSTDICLSDSTLSSLEQSFINTYSENVPIDVEERYEKLQKYKEGLERGMREFLCQAPASVSYKDSYASESSKDGEPKLFAHHKSISPPSQNIQCDISVSQMAQSGGQTKGVSDEANELLSQIDLANESLLMLKAVPGFFLMLDRNKKVLFVSENITKVLGVSQINVIGHDISKLIYDKDYPELEKQMCDEQFLEDKDKGVAENALHRIFYLAMNFCFQKTGSRQKNSGQKLFRWDAKLRLYRDKSTQEIRVKSLFSLCRPVRDDVIAEFQRCEVVFFTRHGTDYKCIYCDPRVQEIMGYTPSFILGTDGFSLKHPCDVMMCHYKHKTLVARGHGDSGYYRLLARNGRWMWAISLYTVIFGKDGQPIHINVQTYIVSMEEAKCVLAREKEDYQRMKNEGFDFDLTYYGLSQPTLATLSAKRTLKRKKFSDNGVQLKKHVHNLEVGNPEQDFPLKSTSFIDGDSKKTQNIAANQQLCPLSLLQPQSTKNSQELSRGTLVTSNISGQATDLTRALGNRTVGVASITDKNSDLSPVVRETLGSSTATLDSSSSVDFVHSQDMICPSENCNSENSFESKDVTHPFENCLANSEFNNNLCLDQSPNSTSIIDSNSSHCSIQSSIVISPQGKYTDILDSSSSFGSIQSQSVTFPAENWLAVIDSNNSDYSVKSHDVTSPSGNCGTILDSSSSVISVPSQDGKSPFRNFAPVYDETAACIQKHGEIDTQVRQSESPISPLLTDSSLGELGVNYSPLPSVEFNSPNIEIDLLMSDISDEEIHESCRTPGPRVACSSSTEEDFEVQTILRYFLSDQREAAALEISPSSDDDVMFASQWTVTRGGSCWSGQTHSPDNMKFSSQVNSSNTGSTDTKHTRNGMGESSSQKCEQTLGIAEVNAAIGVLQCSSHNDIDMNSTITDTSSSSHSSDSSRGLSADLDFIDQCLLQLLDQSGKGDDTTSASDPIGSKSDQLSCRQSMSLHDDGCTAGQSQPKGSRHLDNILEDSVTTELLDWIQQDGSPDVEQPVQTSHISFSRLPPPLTSVHQRVVFCNLTENVFPADNKEISYPNSNPHVNTPSQLDQEIIDYFSTSSNSTLCTSTHFATSTDYQPVGSLLVGLDDDNSEYTDTEARHQETVYKSIGPKPHYVNDDLYSLTEELSDLDILPEMLRDLCDYLE
ncbi:hypothetical protein Btru_046789 [Bulinus truncatus]|nr:hypothetical protein Btru_046789 [Bulinus truncatus]